MEEEEKKIRPQDKWDAKAGVISKTYKVDREVAKAFQEACKNRTHRTSISRQPGSSVGMGTQRVWDIYVRSA